MDGELINIGNRDTSDSKEYVDMSDREILMQLLSRLRHSSTQAYSSKRMAERILHITGLGDGERTHPQHAELYRRANSICSRQEFTDEKIEQMYETQSAFRAFIDAREIVEGLHEYDVESRALAVMMFLYSATQELEIEEDTTTWLSLAAQLTPSNV